MVQIELRCGSYQTVRESYTLSSNRSLRHTASGTADLESCSVGYLLITGRNYSQSLARLLWLGLLAALGRKYTLLSFCWYPEYVKTG